VKEAKIVKANNNNNNNNNILKSQWRGLAGANTTNKHGHIMDKPYLMVLEQLETGRVNFYRQIWLVRDQLALWEHEDFNDTEYFDDHALERYPSRHKMYCSICFFVTKSSENNLKMYVCITSWG
jgi:hypothetical protein